MLSTSLDSFRSPTHFGSYVFAEMEKSSLQTFAVNFGILGRVNIDALEDSCYEDFGPFLGFSDCSTFSDCSDLMGPSNRLNDADIEKVALVLANHTTLTCLDLVGQNFGDRGVAALAEALKINSLLTSIDLSANNIQDQGIKILSTAFTINFSLVSVILNLNYHLTEEGLEFLFCSLESNSSLTRLSLKGIPRSAIKISRLASCLAINTTLTELLFDEQVITCLTKDDGRILVQSLVQNPSLTKLFEDSTTDSSRVVSSEDLRFKAEFYPTQLILNRNAHNLRCNHLTLFNALLRQLLE